MPADTETLYENPALWLEWLSTDFDGAGVDGLVAVNGYDNRSMRPEEVAVMEKAEHYGAQFVFFEASRNNKSSVPQAFVYVSDGQSEDEFADLHRRLWNWGGVPLVYRKILGKVDLFRCAHKPEFFKGDQLKYKPHKTFDRLIAISQELAWWDATRLYNGTLWDDPKICRDFLDSKKSAHRELVRAVKGLNTKLTQSELLNSDLRRRLLILTLLVEYLEERGVLKPDFFAAQLPGATGFFDVLRSGPELVNLFDKLMEWFNGDVFKLSTEEKAAIHDSSELAAFATLVQGFEEPTGQLNFWRLYSFDDLPVELISEIYQLFVEDEKTAVYTPPALVRLILEEVLDQPRMDRLLEHNEVVLDPACGSGVFLVEAYKRLILHWRSRNDWKPPTPTKLKELAKLVHGVDVEPSAIELTNFSLCLAMCDALRPRDIEESVKLFPELKNKSLHKSCFFEAKSNGMLPSAVGVAVGNPPFESKLKTEGARKAAKAYDEEIGPLPDDQIAYLFLHHAMQILVKGGLLGMIQQSGFLYNDGVKAFRQRHFECWKVREVLDFISVRGMFDRDTKVVIVVTEASKPSIEHRVLHAVFRRSGRADAEQSFDIDYYDLHWLTTQQISLNSNVWRANLLGGGRVTSFMQRFRKFPTLKTYAQRQGWDFGEGFIEGKRGVSRPADHIVGQLSLPSGALSVRGIDRLQIYRFPKEPIEGPRTQRRFTPPMLLIREQEELHNIVWTEHYLTYKNKIVGFANADGNPEPLYRVSEWIKENNIVLRAYIASTSIRQLTQKATALASADIFGMPYVDDQALDISVSEKIIAEDIVDFYLDLVRLGDHSPALELHGLPALSTFNDTFLAPINEIYTDKPLTAHPAKSWPGIICQPYSFGPAEVDWSNTETLRHHLDAVLKERQNPALSVTRIARIYDGEMLYLIKPDRLRFWLRSIALRDADDVLADLRAQGF